MSTAIGFANDTDALAEKQEEEAQVESLDKT